MTTDARGPAADVHHRMPLVVPDDRLEEWLAADTTQPQHLLSELVTRPAAVRVTMVSRRVNDVRNDDATLLEAMEEHR
jgi:putative SOS response-associated peptidase YedK